jgi:hypothetical protein
LLNFACSVFKVALDLNLQQHPVCHCMLPALERQGCLAMAEHVKQAFQPKRKLSTGQPTE